MADPVITHDVFVSYNRHDAANAELLATRLSQEGGLRVWLDRERLQPGFSWRGEIETAMNESATALIVWGAQDLGPVQRQERDLAYAIRDAREDFRVVYVFLPEAEPPKGNWASVDTWIRFESSLDEPDVFAQILAALKGEAPPTGLVAELPDEPAPYRGLAAFGVDDTQFFFGRTAYVHEMLERLPHHPFLAVLGPSGSGKTSVVQAGLLARLQANAITGSKRWRQVVVRPGPDPLRALATELSALSREGSSLTAIDTFLERLQAKPSGLAEIIQSLLPSKERLVLVVDRLEELFTLCESDDDRRSFLQALVALTDDPHAPAWVVVTMRADFYGHVARYPDLAGEVVNHQLFIRSMSAEDVAEIIEAPATQVGAIFEKGLAAQIRTDAQVREEVALPLLQHTLDLVWRKRRGRWLTWDAYKEVGGVSGALRYHADRVIEGLSPDQRELARRLLLRLIWLEEGAGVLAGRRVEKPGLVQQFHDPAAAERLLQRLADKRLVTLRDDDEHATAELVHDSLPLHWDRLQQWVQGDREFLLWRQRLRGALAQWVRTDHDAGVLLRGALLTEAERWSSERRDDLTAAEQRFIEESVAQRDREAAVLERRRRRVMVTTAAAAMVFLILAAVAGLQWRRAEVQRDQALVSQSRVLSALSRQKTDAGQATLGTLLALEALPGPKGKDRQLVPDAEASLLHALLAQREKHLLSGHTDGVNKVRFSPDGSLVVTASPDQTARLWNTATGELTAALQGHAGQVFTGEFSPDGEEVVTASSDGTARIWSAETGNTAVTLQGHEGAVYQASFSADGKRVVTASSDGTARVWDAGTGETTAVLAGHESDVFAAAFSRDGREVVTASADGTARLWRLGEMASEGESRVLQGHESLVMDARLSTDGERILTASWDRTAGLWDAATGEMVFRLEGHEDGVGQAAFSPDGELIVTTSVDRTARLWDGVTGEPVAVLKGHEGPVHDAHFSPDGRWLMTAGDDGTARLWDVAAHETVDILAGHTAKVWSGRFSPDGRRLATASEDDTARIWAVAPKNLVAELTGHMGNVHRAVFSPDGRRLVTVSDDPAVRMWDGRTGDEMAVLTGHEGDVWHASFSQDGRRLVTTSTDSTARLWDTATGGLVHTLRGHVGLVNHAHFSPDGRQVVTGGKEGAARVWNVESGEVVARLSGHQGPVNFAEFSHDGRRIATASQDGTAQLWDAATGELVASLTGHRGPIIGGAFSPDDRWFATASWDETARLWDVGSGKALSVLAGHTDSVSSATFSPNGRFVVTASSDNTARTWNARSGEPLLVLQGHGGELYDASFSSDGRLVLTASADGTARLWHAAAGLPVAVLSHRGAVVGAAFAADGRHVATASWDRTARIWRLPVAIDADWIEYARENVPRQLTDDERRLYVGQ